MLVVACGPESGPTASPAVGTSPASAPRDVVLVTLDTLRFDRLGCFGGSVATPRLDELARAGTRFTHAAVPMPETAPSHAALLSGRYPLSHGLTDNWHSLSPEVDTLAEILTRAGVETGCFYNVFQFNDANLVQGFRTQVRDMGNLANDVGPKFLAWLDAAPAGKRTFAWLHYFIAHTPFEPPAAQRAQYVKHDYQGPHDFSARTRLELLRAGGFPPDYAEEFCELYDAEVAFLDQRIGELVDGLRARGRFDSTLLVLIADHGESLDRRSLGLHSFVATQSTLHVPLIVVGPGVTAGRTIEEVVESVDLFPTLLEAFVRPLGAGGGGAGDAVIDQKVGTPIDQEIGTPIDGVSLWPLLRAESVDWDGVAFGSLPCPAGAAGGSNPDRLTVWQGSFKLVVTRAERGEPCEEREQLFDVTADPDELHDVAADHRDITAALRRRLDDWVVRTKAAAAPAGPISRAGEQMLKQLGYGDR